MVEDNLLAVPDEAVAIAAASAWLSRLPLTGRPYEMGGEAPGYDVRKRACPLEREQWGLLRTCLDVARCSEHISNLVPTGYAGLSLQKARAQGNGVTAGSGAGGSKGASAQTAFLITWYLAPPYPSEDMPKEQDHIALTTMMMMPRVMPRVTGKYPTTFAAWIKDQKHVIALGV